MDAVLVTRARNVTYLTGFTGDDSALLLTRGQGALITDGRYTEQAAQETRGIEIVRRRRGLMAAAGRRAARAGVARLGIEAHAMTVAQRDELAGAAPHAAIISMGKAIEGQRQIKDADERRRIEEAVRVAEQAFARIRPAVRPGRTERELAHMLEAAMLDLGAEGPSFPSVVASGPRTSLPHAQPTDRRLRRGDAVLFDWGALKQGYRSDLTRMLFVGTISPFYARTYDLVYEAQRRALRRVKAGLTADKIDSAARGFLKSKRRAKYFSHGLGHGIGLDVHEAPALNGQSRTALKPGMIFTVEPGVYLPGRGGVRIEDDVLVTGDGSRVLSSAPKSLRQAIIGT